MAEDLSLKFDIDSDAAVAGVESVNKALGGTKTAAAEAAPALSAVDQAAKNLQTALDKLGASDGPRGMIKNAALAQVALEQYKTAATGAGVSTDDMARRVTAAGTQIEGAAAKVGIFKKAQADLTAQGALAGSQLDKLRQSGTSLGGMFESMERTGTGVTKAFGELGMSLGIAGLAFEAAKIAGEKLGAAIDFVATKTLKLLDTQLKGKAAAETHAAAMRALDAGLIANSNSVAGLDANYQKYLVASGLARDETDKFGKTVAGLTVGKTFDEIEASASLMGAEIEGAFKKSTAQGIAWAQANEKDVREVEARYREMGEAVPAGIRLAIDALDRLKSKQGEAAESMKHLAEVAKTFPASMQLSIENETKLAAAARLVQDAHDKLVPSLVKTMEALHSGKMSTAEATAELTAYATANKLTVDQVMKMVTEQGDLSESLRKTDEAFAAQLGNLSSAAEKMGTFAERTRDAAAALKEANTEFAANEAIVRARNAAVDAAIPGMEKLAGGTTAAAGSMATMTTQLTLLQGTFFSVAAATDAQNKALEDLLKTQNAYTSAIAHTLDTAKGWKDYLAGLADAYKTGAIDLLQYKTRLEDFRTQLQMMFSGATGEARKAIESMTQAIQKLIETAGAGGAAPFDMSPTGQLNRTFNNP